MSTPGTQPQAAGWYPDPAGSGGQRWHDGQGWTGQVVQDSGAPPQSLDHRFAGLSDWLARLLLVNAGLAVVYVVVEFWGVGTMTDFEADPANGDLGALQTYDDVTLVLSYLTIALLLFTGIVWMVWQRRLARAAPAKLRNGPGMHVGSWFIPVANLWLPFQNMGDLWRAYEPRSPQSSPSPVSMLVPWWIFFLLSSLLGRLTFSQTMDANTLDAYRSAAELSAAASLVTAVSAVLACLVVRRLGWRALFYHSAAA